MKKFNFLLSMLVFCAVMTLSITGSNFLAKYVFLQSLT